MSVDTTRFLVFGVLMIHGLGHGGAIGALLFRRLDAVASDRAGWLAARSWLLPSLDAGAAATVATLFWMLSMAGFIAAALSFWGILVPSEAWSVIAIVSSIVSLAGIIVFAGTWPPFNTVAALAVNLAVLVTQLWLHWPVRTTLVN
jgi:hypothetical protein